MCWNIISFCSFGSELAAANIEKKQRQRERSEQSWSDVLPFLTHIQITTFDERHFGYPSWNVCFLFGKYLGRDASFAIATCYGDCCFDFLLLSVDGDNGQRSQAVRI